MTKPNRVERQRVQRMAARAGFHLLRAPVRHPDAADFETYYLVPIGARHQQVMAERCNSLKRVESVIREVYAPKQ